jgi:hypothetical protein
MGKVRQIFIWNGTQDLGPFRRTELVEQLELGTVLPSHYYFEEGMSEWARVAALPCCARLLASDAQKTMLSRMGIEYDEFLTKSDVSRILDNAPATERQIALLKYLGIEAPPSLTKNAASELLDVAKGDPLMLDKLDAWNVDRLELHADIYAGERIAFKNSRAQALLEQYHEFQADLQGSGVRVRRLTLEELNSAIAKLDATRPGWDRELRLNGLDHVLDVLDKAG